jgi:hypothetical protein
MNQMAELVLDIAGKPKLPVNNGGQREHVYNCARILIYLILFF